MLPNDGAASLAIAMLEFRQSRSTGLPIELFGEPAWELLLELFVADARSRKLTARDVCERRDLNPRAMSRYLMFLTAQELIVGDGSGNLDDPLTLSGRALEVIERILQGGEHLRDVLQREHS